MLWYFASVSNYFYQFFQPDFGDSFQSNFQGATIKPSDVATEGKFCCLLKSCPVKA